MGEAQLEELITLVPQSQTTELGFLSLAHWLAQTRCSAVADCGLTKQDRFFCLFFCKSVQPTCLRRIPEFPSLQNTLV